MMSKGVIDGTDDFERAETDAPAARDPIPVPQRKQVPLFTIKQLVLAHLALK